MSKHPISVYINWAAYDELSDNVELTEELALRQLDELLRLREVGVRFDYYLMDAFWYATDGAYRTWRQPHWPNGPDAWLKRCIDNGVKPGLWVTANTLCKMECPPAWRESLDVQHKALCCFYGGFLADYIQALHEWYARGVRAFKFDFANFQAAPQELRNVMLPSEIRAANVAAWQGAMKAFRQAHPEVLLMAYNGFEEAALQHGTSVPMVKAIDHRWLDVFDSMYCGDPRPADVPAMNFWRAKDVYSDHMVRVYAWNGVPLPRIDNSGFMIGTTGTCYYRRTAAWQGMLILSLARGGWVHTCYGNLDLLDETKGRWFARVQELYHDLHGTGATSTFGGMPGTGAAYGFATMRGHDGLLAVVNAGQEAADLELPIAPDTPLRLLFTDAGFRPVLSAGSIRLGPEQMALIGIGQFAAAEVDLGVQEDVRIPGDSRLLAEVDGAENERTITCTLDTPPRDGTLRVIMRQSQGTAPLRMTGGSPPAGISLGNLLLLQAEQDGVPVPLTINYDKAIWSGLSWAVGELDCAALSSSTPLTVRFISRETRPVTLHGSVYHLHEVLNPGHSA